MAAQDEKNPKKAYKSYDEYYKNFHGDEGQEKSTEWDETPTSFAKWLTRSIVLKANVKKSTGDPAN